jgi:predicted ABC-type ATPase
MVNENLTTDNYDVLADSMRCSKPQNKKISCGKRSIKWWIRANRRRIATNAESRLAPKSMAAVRHNDFAATTAACMARAPA